MKQTHSYSANQYVRDNGFPLSWMCRCCCTSQAEADMRAEAAENHERSKTQPATIIGRPAGYKAHTGRSAMRYQLPSREQDAHREGEDPGEAELGT